jgi:hypothetical protein
VNYAARHRAELSKRHLTKRYGRLFEQWAVERMRVWGIEASWGLEELARHLDLVRQNEDWEKLVGTTKVAELDYWIREFAGCAPRFKRSVVRTDLPVHLTVDQIAERLRSEIPELSRAQLRSLLHRAAKRGVIERASRGSYQDAAGDEEWYQLVTGRNRESDEDDDRWLRRCATYERRRTTVLLVHYLLPHLASYRKARGLGLSDRTYFYDLSEAVDRVQEMCSARLEMCSRKLLI